jgi:dUTPase
MVLNGQEIAARNLVTGARPEGYRNASYDLRIGLMFSAKEEGDFDKFVLEPQGLVEVISAERVELPPNVVGYAMVKTTLCNEGIFAINIGMVDPGYSGLLSSTLVNLGKKPYPLLKDQVFLRLAFHEFTPQKTSKLTVMDDEAYLADKRSKVKERFADSFLNISETVRKVSEEIVPRLFDKWKTTLLWAIPVAAVIFSLFSLLAILVNWGATWSSRNALMDAYSLRKDLVSEVRQPVQDQSNQRIDALERQLRELSVKLDSLQSSVGTRGAAAGQAPQAPKR